MNIAIVTTFMASLICLSTLANWMLISSSVVILVKVRFKYIAPHFAYIAIIHVSTGFGFAFSTFVSYLWIECIFPIVDAFEYFAAFLAATNEFCVPFAPIKFMFQWVAWGHFIFISLRTSAMLA
jgi:hypothetical protein